MSLSAKSLTTKSAKSKLSVSQSLQDALFEEGYEYVAGRLELLAESAGQLTPELAEEIARRGWGMPPEKFLAATRHLTKGALWMAKRVGAGAQPDLRQLVSDYAAYKDLWAWQAHQDTEYLRRMDIDHVGKLFHIGIRFAWQADRFCRLYSEVCNESRPWGSCYQPSHGKVKAIALTPNYNRLPLWVKQVMVRSEAWIQSGEDARVGHIWRLIPCAKAWKWAPSLPKGIAEKIGKLSPKARVIAAIAWNATATDNYDWEINQWCKRDRATVSAEFFQNFKTLYVQPAITLIEKIAELEVPFFSAMEVLIGLPYGTLERQSLKGLEAGDIENLVIAYLSLEDAAQHLLGCCGRATLKAFQSSHRNAVKWAGAIAYGNPDACQQFLFLSISDCVEFQSDAVELLKSLGWRSALRLIQKTEFRYRSETHPVSDYHVRDTGYLWNQIARKPDLGRARCWFSLHETLASAYVEELPDGDVRVPTEWVRVDGLASVSGRWEIELPRRVAQLKFWGQAFNNCVGGYGAAINSGRSIVFAVKERGMLSHCVEVSPHGRVQQFLSKGNQGADWDLENSVVSALRQAGLLEA